MYIFLGILAFIALLLLLPIFLIVKYDEKEIYIYYRYLFFKVMIHPRKEKEKRPKQPDIAPKKAPQKKGFEDFKGTHHQIIDFLKAGIPEGRKLLERGLITVIKLKVVVATDDAAETAIQYGRMNAYVVGALALLENFVKIKKKKINICLDFLKDEYEWHLYMRFMLLPIVGTIVAIRLLLNYGKNSMGKQETNKNKEVKGGVPK